MTPWPCAERGRARRAVVPLLALGLLVGGGALLRRAAPASAPTPQEVEARRQRGRALFHQGVGVDGKSLQGRLGPERVPLSGAATACARCHGPEGRGTVEGGVQVPDIRAARLAAPAGAGTPAERPAYDRALLVRALTGGLASSGRPLDWVMPRFVLGPEEREGLLAYLEVLGEERAPGVFADRLVLGTALPLRGPLAPVGEDVRAVLEAAFAEVNRGGGVYGRRLELHVEDAAAPGDATERLLGREVLALVGSVVPGAGTPAPDARLDAAQVPLLAPVGLSDSEEGAGHMVFQLYPGPRLQARAVVQHLHGQWDRLRPLPLLAVVQDGSPLAAAWVRGAREEAQRRELPPPRVLEVPGSPEEARALARQLRTGAVTAVLLAGQDARLLELAALLEAELPAYAPLALAHAAPAVREGALGRVRFVAPPGPEGRRGAEVLGVFLQRHGLRPRNVAFQASALAAAGLAVEALRRCGAEPTRPALVEALEGIQDLPTGTTPPLTFGTGGRVGVRGIRLLQRSPASGGLVPVEEWIALSR